MLALLPRDVSFPWDAGKTLAESPVVIALQPKKGTKVKRPQFAYLRAAHADLVRILHMLVQCTDADTRLFPVHITTYRAQLRRFETAYNLQVGWTPHSGRAGFAVTSRTEGWSFTEIREAGRWSVDSTLRGYLDVVGSAEVATRLQLAGLGAALQWANHYWTLYFLAEVLEAQSGCRRRVGPRLAQSG